MKISIRCIRKNTHGELEVVFFSEYGECVGIWHGNEPKLKDYFVEIDIPSPITEIKVVNEKKHCMQLKDRKVRISGIFESYDDDGYATLRLKDSIVCFETNYNENLVNMLGKFVEVNVDYIDIYDEMVI
ncbi:hypothetical protein P8V03_18930 [Clostridium sp. A1-XYC3]|uniref:YopX protein domain-containing protein n=1 Tax=Clostridium tanneri TaxID=3037988 RepID=A0ABU4JYK2_9CLOT|nr:hypothetical protein [Clostridium sp. A1-XYC3]MDW8803206.1 hypothetical protein [Clostridium sp. A1-XYC3]